MARNIDVSARNGELRLTAGGETLLLSTHDIEDVAHFLGRAVMLQNGRIAEDLVRDSLTPGDTLLNHMAHAGHWGPRRWLEFEEG